MSSRAVLNESQACNWPGIVKWVPGKVHGGAGVDDGGQDSVRDAASLGHLQDGQLTTWSR